MTINELKKAMADNVVNFTYLKADGTCRYAVGTRNPEIIHLFLPNREQTATRKQRNISNDVLCYFDLTKLAFRSCRIGRVMGINSIDSNIKRTLIEVRNYASLLGNNDIYLILDNVLDSISNGDIIISSGIDRHLAGDCGGVSVRIVNAEKENEIQEKIKAMHERVDNLLEQAKSIKRDLTQLELCFS